MLSVIYGEEKPWLKRIKLYISSIWRSPGSQMHQIGTDILIFNMILDFFYFFFKNMKGFYCT